MQRISSGIEGVDHLLGGGLPQGRAVLVAGEPGVGKTILTLQFLLEGLKNGELGVYISIDERAEHVIQDALSLGWELAPYLQSGQLKMVDLTQPFSTHSNSSLSMTDMVDMVLGYVKTQSVTRLVVDPVAPLRLIESEIKEIGDYIRSLIYAIEGQGDCTTLLTSYSPVGSHKVSTHGIEEFATSGILVLKLEKMGSNYARTIRVKKMRGTRTDLSEWVFEIMTGRGIVLRQAL
ncbi:hypothetical protein EBZ35_02430 [bacterium]|nr:hypothetical protein [bacterium]